MRAVITKKITASVESRFIIGFILTERRRQVKKKAVRGNTINYS